MYEHVAVIPLEAIKRTRIVFNTLHCSLGAMKQVEYVSQRATFRHSYCSGVGYLKGNIFALVTENDSRNLFAECRLPAGSGQAGLQRILNENIGGGSLSLSRIHLIFAQIDIAKEPCLRFSGPLFFYFFYHLEVRDTECAHVRRRGGSMWKLPNTCPIFNWCKESWT